LFASLSAPLLSKRLEYVPVSIAPFPFPSVANTVSPVPSDTDTLDLSLTFRSAERSVYHVLLLANVADTGNVELSLKRTYIKMSSSEALGISPLTGLTEGS